MLAVRLEESRSDLKTATGKPEGKRPLGRPRFTVSNPVEVAGFFRT
jgi:hypothetical protein